MDSLLKCNTEFTTVSPTLTQNTDKNVQKWNKMCKDELFKRFNPKR
jgi:hypothetical protein